MVRNMFRNVFKVLNGETLDDDFYYLYLHEQAELRAEALSHAGEILEGIAESQSYSGFPHTDFDLHGNANGRYGSYTLNTLNEMERLAKHYHCSISNLIVAAAANALSEYNGESRIKIRWTYNGREEKWEKMLVGITIESISTNIDLDDFDSNEGLIQEIKEQSIHGIRYSTFSSAFDDMSPGLSERTNIVYQNGSDMPENAPEGVDIKATFDYHTGAISMFQIMISEQEEDEPLKAIFVYNKKRYKEKSVAEFADIFHRKLAELQTDGN
jgi:hypothetical protein